jgi:hypothetical protein
MSYPNHDTTTTDHRACEACAYREATDEYAHGRADNFYRRFHLYAVAHDRQAAVTDRIAACDALTHPSYPKQTRDSARLAGDGLRSLLTAATIAVVRVP